MSPGYAFGGLSAVHVDADDLRVAELVRIRALGPQPRSESVGGRPPRRLEAVAEPERPLLVRPRGAEGTPLAAVEHLQVDDLATRRKGLAAQPAAERHRLPVRDLS